MLGGSGTVIANGTAASPIIFTSYKDDVHGGDTSYTFTLSLSADSKATVTNCTFAHNDGSDSIGRYIQATHRFQKTPAHLKIRKYIKIFPEFLRLYRKIC